MFDLLRPRQVRDVDQAVNTFLDFYEYTEVSEVTNLSRMTRTYREALLDVFPRISLQLLDTKRHLTLVTVQSQDYGFDLVANLHEVLSGTQVLCPRHL